MTLSIVIDPLEGREGSASRGGNGLDTLEDIDSLDLIGSVEIFSRCYHRLQQYLEEDLWLLLWCDRRPNLLHRQGVGRSIGCTYFRLALEHRGFFSTLSSSAAVPMSS